MCNEDIVCKDMIAVAKIASKMTLYSNFQSWARKIQNPTIECPIAQYVLDELREAYEIASNLRQTVETDSKR